MNSRFDSKGKMCDYCKKPIGKAIAHGDGLSIWIEHHYKSGKAINASLEGGCGDEVFSCIINYCPMCGRKLEAIT